jgi:hypothetical protein
MGTAENKRPDEYHKKKKLGLQAHKSEMIRDGAWERY